MADGLKRRKLSNGKHEAIPKSPSKEGDSTEKKHQRRSLFVRSLPSSVTTERLTEHFSQSYPLKHATVVLDPQTKISKGFGFITFADAEDAQAALAELDNSMLDGRKIKVELAESRQRELAEGERKSGPNTKAVELKAEREKQRIDTLPPKLIVRNLPWSIKDSDSLAALFRSYGKVRHALVPNKGPRVQAGFGFVVLRGHKNAEKAIQGVNGKVVDGRTLAVDWAVDKTTWQKLQGEQANDIADSETKNSASNIGDSQIELMSGSDSSSIDPGLQLEDDSQDEPVVHSNSDESALSELDESIGDGESNFNNEHESQPEDSSDDTTIFIRNLPFTATDDDLKAHFVAHFGPVRYARVVIDPETGRSKGTAFVCFFNVSDAKVCVQGAPKLEKPSTNSNDRKSTTVTHSILQNDTLDPTGIYTLDSRTLQISRALSRSAADTAAKVASSKRETRDRDKRRLYLLSEGTISPTHPLYSVLPKSDIDIRASSLRQRQNLMKTNPNLCLSLVRLSVRNIPRSFGSKELKALAREAVVEFATDVKAGKRQPLSKEELSREAEQMRVAERERKARGKGIVKQAVIVFEGREGAKVKEVKGSDGAKAEGGGAAGRSRGYGFIEYISHRNALMGLRWLNGRAVKAGAAPGAVGVEKNKRLIVEFAIENARVVQRREEREVRARSGEIRGRYQNKVGNNGRQERGPEAGGDQRSVARKDTNRRANDNGKGPRTRRQSVTRPPGWNKKRKRDESTETGGKDIDRDKTPDKPVATSEPDKHGGDKNSAAKRNRIIAKKRQMRRNRK